MGRPRAKPGITAVSSTPIPAATSEDQPECKNASSQESDPCFHDITPYEHDQLDSASVRYLRPDRQFGRHTERRGWCETPGGLRDGPLGGEAPGCVTLRNCWATDLWRQRRTARACPWGPRYKGVPHGSVVIWRQRTKTMSRMASEIRELSERIESLGTKQKVKLLERVLTPEMELRFAMEHMARRSRHVSSRVLDRAADRAIQEVRRERAERRAH